MEMLIDNLHKAIDLDQCILIKLEELERDPSNKNLIAEIKADLARQAEFIRQAQRDRHDIDLHSTTIANR